MDFELLSEIKQIEPIARGAGVDIHNYLNRHEIGRVGLKYKKGAKR